MARARRLLPAALVAALSIASSACAGTGALYQYRPPPTPVRAVDERAYVRGYDEGRARGETDARRNRSLDYTRHGDYRDADAGYRGYGDRNAYRTLFRQGFVAGYNGAYRRFARGGVYSAPVYTARYSSPAAQAGYRDGFDQGRDDARGGDRYDPIRAPRYRSGDRDFNSRYGSRETYKQEYRAAFEQGYERGYRDSWR